MAANNDRPPLLRAVYANNIVKCRRLINTGEANANGDISLLCVPSTVLLGVPDPGGE